ncbi:MAG: RNA polymerase-associated protein RapA, partial [Gammaproteobacteria bacterium]
MTIQYIPGQRWVSNTESELGLGIVMETANRRVTVSFPAVGQRRTYAMDNAPLSRVHYEVGEKIISADGINFIVSEVQDQGGYLIYKGTDHEGKEINLEEIDLESFVQFSRPQDRLFAGQIDKISSFQLRVETLFHMRRQQKSSCYGLLGPRVQLLPHQLYIADKVARRHAPRVLLADEVGLGKTIEAGMILHKQLITGSANRVLIVVPDSLVHQWFVEMSRRFNVQFTILDEERCIALEAGEHGNPFDSAQYILCALTWITDNENRQNQAHEALWDILIVDEAHHLNWTPNEVSPAYACIESLAKKVPSLLLLTATPEQLGIEGHFARLRLLDPDRYYDLQKFRQEEESYQVINTLVQKLLAVDAEDNLLNDNEFLNELESYLGIDVVNKFKISLKNSHAKQSIDEVIQNILDRHGTGRVLFRNTRDAVEGFPQRKLHTYPLKAPKQYSEIISQDKIKYEDTAKLIPLLCPELLLGHEWFDVDPRVEWLSEWLLKKRDEKVLVICAFS